MKNYLALLLFISVHVSAQNFVAKTDSAWGYKFTYVENDPINARTYVLKNGLTVMMSVNKTSPRIYTCIGTKAGSKNDPKDATGLAHYLEHMLFKGTDRFGSLDFEKEKSFLDKIDILYSKYGQTKDPVKRKKIYHDIDSISGLASKFAIANEYDKMLQYIGAKGTNAYTSFDETVYINDIPSNRIADWVHIEAERFRNPILRLFHTELEAVYEEKNISLDSDGNKVFEVLFESLFKRHPYGTQTTIGTIDHLKNPSLQKIRDYYNSWYVPNNMIISIAGNFDPEQTLALIDSSFGKFSSKPIPSFTFTPEKSDNTPEEITVLGPESPSVTIGFRLPGAKSEELALMQVTDMLLNSPSGIFDLNLIKKQQVLSASSGIYNLKDYSVLFMDAQPKNGQTLEEVKNLLLAQLDSLKKGKFDSKAISSSVLNKEVSEIKAAENNNSRAYSMLNAFIQERSWKDVVEESEKMKKITAKDVTAFANKWFNNEYTLVYKKEGVDSNVVKIEKPEITPIEVNRNSMSRFTKDVLDNEAKSIKPQFLDYTKDISKVELQPGINLLSLKNSTNKLFNLYYVFEFGRNNDLLLPEAIHLLEYLGTDKLSNEQISKDFYSIGCSFDVFEGGNELLYVRISGPQEKFERAISTFEHLLAHAIPDQKALDSMIENEIQERENAKQDKNRVRGALTNYTRFGKDNPTTWNLSTKKLKKLKADDLTNIIHKLTAYPHTILYYGPLESKEIQQEISKYHKTPTVLNSVPVAHKFTYQENKERKVFFTHYDMVQAEIGWIRNAGPYNAEEQPSISMFNEYFGGGMSSVVFQTIRESKALAYSSYAYFSKPTSNDKPNTTGAYIGTQADKLDSAIYAMDDLLTTMPQTEILFSGSKASLLSQIESERILKEDILFNYLASKRLGIDYDIRKSVYEKIPSMNLSDVNAFHQKHLSAKPFNLFVVGSSNRIPKKKLAKYGKVKVLSLEDIFGY
jgi:predicted Zn-dependent peptidase